MKRFIILFTAFALVASLEVCGQTRKEISEAKHDAKEAYKSLKRDGFKPIELGDPRTNLEKFFLKVNSGCPQIVGASENCMSINLAKVTALANAANEYALVAGGTVRGRIVSSVSNLSGQQLDNLVSSFERLVQKEIRGEMMPLVTAIKDRKGSISARVFCVVDIDSAHKARQRALELALEEQALAEKYGSMVSEWVHEGFEDFTIR